MGGTIIINVSDHSFRFNKLLSLTYNTTPANLTQSYLCSVYTCRTSSCSFVSLALPSVSSSVQITNRSPHLCEINFLLHSVNLIVFTLLLVYLMQYVVCSQNDSPCTDHLISPCLHSHNLPLPQLFNSDLKPICSIYPFVDSFSVLFVLPSRNLDSDQTIWALAFLSARRYASAGYSDRNVSVCPSRAGIVSKRRKLAAWFLHHLVAPRL